VNVGRDTPFLPLLHPPIDLPLAKLPVDAVESLTALKVNESSLEALNNLRTLVHDPWPESLPIDRVRTAFDGFAKTSPQDAEAMRGYLSVRARMEGRPDVAAKFVPKGETPDAKSVLRDLNVVQEMGATPPPGSSWADLPLPEAERLGLKPAVRETLMKDFPGPVDELSAGEVRARRVALRSIDAGAESQFHHYHLHLHNIMRSLSTSEQDDREDEVERQVGGKLTPAERLLARRLLRTKKSDQVTAILRPMVQK
jgi:hypothetical protein